jgi:hypothetical protein
MTSADEESVGGISEGMAGTSKSVKEILDYNTSMKGIMQDVRESEDSWSNISKYAGFTRESAVSIKTFMGDAYSEVAKLGGEMKDIEDMHLGLMKATNTNILVAKDYQDDLFAAAKVAGTSTESLTKAFVDAGYSVYNIGEEMNGVFNTAREMGVSLSKVTEQVLSNMDKLDDHNFSGGVDGLAKMAATTATLRVDMGTIMGVVDKAFDPEGAIKMASAFQRLGVTQSELLDPMKLMNMSMNDPEQFAKSLGEMGKSLTELDEKGNVRIAPGSIRKMKQLAQEMGISTGELAKMSKAAKEAEIKMQKIQFPSDMNISEEQKQLLMNVSQMKDGEVKIRTKSGDLEDINKVLKDVGGDKDKLKELMEANTPKTTEELLRESNTYHQEEINALNALRGKTGKAIASSSTTEKFLEAQNQLVKGVTNSFDKALNISDIRKGFDENIGGISDALANLATGKGSMSDVAKAFNDAATKTAEGLNKVYDDVKKYGSDETEKIMGGKNEYAKAVVTILDKFVEYAGKIEKVNLDLVDNKKTETLKEITEPTLTKINPATSTNVLKDISVGSGISEQQLEKILNVESKTNNFSGEMTLKLDVNAPPGMDVKQLEIMLKDPKVREAVINTIHAAKTNDGAKGYMGRK